MAEEARKTIAAQVQEELKNTRFACSVLEPLTGGTANFLFRGVLDQPLSDGTEAVAIKHGEDHVALNPNFKLTTTRCQFEEECLKAASARPPVTYSGFAVSVPKLYHFNPETNTQVQQYLPGALDLKTYCLKYFSDPSCNDDPKLKAECTALGKSLGAWLRSFHQWAREPEQAELTRIIRSNHEMQALKNRINYDGFLRAIDRFPDILGDARETFTQVQAMTKAELADESRHQLIHGDFWTGNALLPDLPLVGGEGTDPKPVFVIDWEMAQTCVRPLDLGQMIAEMYELFLFKGISAGKWFVEGFAAGYDMRADGDGDDFAYRVAIHAGVHLVHFGSGVPGWGSDEQVREVVAKGRDIISQAWIKDREWFEKSDLACLFPV